jgi:phage gp45-like
MSLEFNRIQNIITVGKSTAPTNDSSTVQSVQIQFNNLQTTTHLSSQHFGLASAPPVGTDFVLVSLAGDKTSALAISSNNNQFRPINLQTGETQIYDNAKQSIYLQQGQKIAVNAMTEIDFMINGKLIMSITENGVNINVPITSTADGMFNGISIDKHTHGYIPGDGELTQTQLPQG